MKLFNREKKEYKCDRVIGIVCSIVYAVCLLYIRFIDYFANIFPKEGFCIISMFPVIIIVFLNYLICRGGMPNRNLYNEINDFDLATNNKKEIREQRDSLLKNLESTKFSKKSINAIIVAEVVASLVVCGLFFYDIKIANIATGIVVDIETAIMTFMFFIDIHYKFKIEKI